MTAPPRGGPITHTGHGAGAAAANDAVQMSLGDQGEAALTVLPATTDTNGQKLSATRVTLKVANPGRDIAPIPVPMSMRDGVWVANCRFPFPGTSGHLAPINLMPTVGAGVSDISHVQSGVLTPPPSRHSEPADAKFRIDDLPATPALLRHGLLMCRCQPAAPAASFHPSRLDELDSGHPVRVVRILEVRHHFDDAREALHHPAGAG
jgi:hypothetical protein